MHPTAHPALRAVLTLVLALALAASVLVAGAADAQQHGPYTNLQRLDAGSFVDAGRLVSQEVFPGKANAAILATTANFPDALASSALAANAGAPVLFTDRDDLPSGTAAELDRVLEPGATVVIMGGVEAITERVRGQIEQRGFATERLSGRTRLETAAAAARRIGVPGGLVVIARAYGETPERDRTTGWVDSVSCGAYAARHRVPILLTETGRLSGTTAHVIAELGADRAIVCGGTAAVSSVVTDELTRRGVAVQRVSGRQRVETSVAVARDLFGFTTAAGRRFILVNGYDANYGFGLAATQLAARDDAPILLTGRAEPTSCASGASRATLCYLESAGGSTGRVTVVGSVAQVDDAVAEAAAAALGGQRAQPHDPPTNVRVDDPADDGSRLVVHWDAPADPQGTLAGFNVYVGEGAPSGRVGGSPSAGPQARSLTVGGLTPGRTYHIEVSAVNTAGQESGRSSRISATPTDERPGAVRELRATPGDGRVVLTWGPNSEPDVAEYRVERSGVVLGSCNSAGFGEIARAGGRSTTSFTDDTVTNGESYCYRLRAADTAGQTSAEAAQAGPVTPSAQAVTLSVTEPAGGAALHVGAPQTIRYTLDAPEPRQGLTVRVEVSTDDGATYSEITTTAHGVPGTERSLQWTVRPDEDTGEARIRITAFDGGTYVADGRTGRFSIDRAPSAVRGAAATVTGSSAIRVSWDANREAIVSGYEIERRVVTGIPSTMNTDQACSSPSSGRVEGYATVSGRTTTAFTDTDVSPNSSSASEQRYCYRVRALRTAGADGQAPKGAYSSETSTTIPAQGAPDVALRTPEDGETIRRNHAYTVRYTVTQPSGSTVDRVRLSYCVDHRAGSALTAATCADADGWKLISQRRPISAGEHELVWQVGSIAQGDDARGAVRAQVYATAEQSNDRPSATDVRTGIRFR